jgi:methionyl-tRNA formyltransferase
MSIVYLGTPEEAVPPLRALVAAGHHIALVVTQPDRRRGRGREPSPSPVKRAARELGLSVRTPARAREVIDDVRASGAVAGVVVAFGQLLPAGLLDAVALGFVNVHFSLLPRWRGAAPVERAILAGDSETGVCVMRLDEGMDTGPLFACRSTAIAPRETAGELATRLVDLGTALLLEVLPALATAAPTPQAGTPTPAPKLTVDEFRLDAGRTAIELERIVRAGNPRPGAWMVVGGHRIKVLRAHADVAAVFGAPGTVDRSPAALMVVDGALLLDEVQPAGGRAMSGEDWLAGVRELPLTLERA